MQLSVVIIFILVQISVWWTTDAATAEWMAVYRSFFEENWEKDFVYNTTGDHIRVSSLIQDPNNPDDFIVSTNSLVIVHLDTQAQNATILAGAINENGFVNGVGTDTRYKDIDDLCYVPGIDEIILSDSGNNCLRIFNRNNLTVSSYAGECETKGDIDGYRLDARLDGIHTFLFDESTQLLYMSDKATGKIKILSMLTEEISTFVMFNSTTKVRGFTMFNDKLIIIKDNSVVEGTPSTDFVEIIGNLNYSSGTLKRIVSLSNLYHLVTDYAIGGLLLLDKPKASFDTVCKRHPDFSSLEMILNCSLPELAIDVVLNKGVVYLPITMQDKFVVKTVQLNCSKVNWVDWSRCNSSVGVGTQHRTRGYPCEHVEERRLCWNRPTSDDDEAYYVTVSNQCSLSLQLVAARNRMECALHCSSDDECRAFSYDMRSKECRVATTSTGGSADCFLKGT